MTHASLFSGIGGFDLAAEWVVFKNIFQVEIDDYCNKILAKQFPHVKRYGDIKEFVGREYTGAIDVLSGGFPCQPFSLAGIRKGTSDPRYLWPEMYRIIKEIRPHYVLAENVYGIISQQRGVVFERICSDLENQGYQVQPFIIAAGGVGALHKRYRVWFLAHSESLRLSHWGESKDIFEKNERSDREVCRFSSGPSFTTSDMANSDSERFEKLCKPKSKKKAYFTKRFGGWEVEPSMGRVANGIPRRVARLKALGNAIVPQVALQFFEIMKLCCSK